MILNIVSLVIILLITFFMATQGMLTALIALVTAVFSSILAMALVEPLQGITKSILGANYAFGTTLLAIFLVVFGATRVIADALVPQNIKLPQMVNSIVGGTLGFIMALVVMGTTIIGIETLPIQKVVLGFDRFPENNAEAYTTEDPHKPVTAGASLWFAPERFTQAIWTCVSAHALGGNKSWGETHPDISREAYIYRSKM